VPYAWDFPAARDKKILLTINGSRRVIDVMEIGDLVPFKFQVLHITMRVLGSVSLSLQDDHRNRAVSLDVRADGHKQILRITNYNPEYSLYKPRNRSNSGSIARQDTIASNTEGFEAITEEIKPTLTFKVEFAGIGVSLINRKIVEVVYLSMDILKFEYTNSAIAQAVNFSCGTLQLDNQLHDAIFPVILQPTPIPKESNSVAALPTVQASVIWLKDQGERDIVL
jgi:Vacuolar protein sorting-associated protein